VAIAARRGGSMDWKNGQKPVGFHENRRNRSGPVSSVFVKTGSESEIFLKIDFFEKNGFSVLVPVYR
jgi:hypothetical protein